MVVGRGGGRGGREGTKETRRRRRKKNLSFCWSFRRRGQELEETKRLIGEERKTDLYETSASGGRGRSCAAREDTGVHHGALCSCGERQKAVSNERDVWNRARFALLCSSSKQSEICLSSSSTLDLLLLKAVVLFFTLCQSALSPYLSLILPRPRRVGDPRRRTAQNNVGTFDPDRRRRKRRVE